MSTRNIFLKTDTVSLVLLEKRDAPTLLKWMHDPEVTKYLGRGVLPITSENEVSYVEHLYDSNADLTLGIWHTADKKLIGSAGFHQIDQLNQTATFGIVIGNKKYWGLGIGTTVLDAFCAYGFDTRNLRSVKLRVIANNPRGIRCYEKCGFEHVGTHRKHLFKGGEWYDEMLMIRYRTE